MEKKICFVNDTPLAQRDYHRFGFEIFLARGFDVSFLDMTRVLHPDYLANYQPATLSDYHDVVIARTREDVLSYVKKRRRAFAIVLLGYEDRTRFLYKAFRKYRIQYAQHESMSFPARPQPRPAGRIKSLWTESNQNIWAFVNAATKRLTGKCVSFGSTLVQSLHGELQPPRYSLRAARNAVQISPKLGRHSEILWIHSLDYDLYLQLNKNGTPEPDSRYCVFLDEYFPFHPDYSTSWACRPDMDVEKYYQGIGRFFDCVEREMNLPVVIAAHPRARYDLAPDYFGGRRVEQFRTSELVSRSTVVIAHESRSIDLAVMFRKPVIFLTSDEVDERSVFGPMIRNFAAALGKRPINVDREITFDPRDELVVNEEKYMEYLESYIKNPGTPEKPYWEVVADRIEGDYFS